MSNKVLKLTVLLTVTMMLLFAFGCTQTPEADNQGDQANDAQEQDKGVVKLGYVQWAGEIASTNVVSEALKKMGYETELISLGAAAMWQGVAEAEYDFMTSAWLPVTHADYYEQTKDEIDDLGENLSGVRIGWVVPEYVTIDSIEEMNENAEKFDGKIIGIDPGAGLMGKSEIAMEEYGLDNFELVSGSGATMTAALKEAIENEEWVVVTGWSPHWKFAQWDLKYLEDPKKVFGEEEHVSTIARQGLKEDMPEVYEFADNFHWDSDAIQEVMLMNMENDDPAGNAKKWVEENEDKVQEWIPDSK